MFRFALKLTLSAAAIWAVWTYVPVHGRTLAERWRSAGSLPAFVERGWAEAGEALGVKPAPKPQARQPVRRPSERHTESDRRAVERIIARSVDGAR